MSEKHYSCEGCIYENQHISDYPCIICIGWDEDHTKWIDYDKDEKIQELEKENTELKEMIKKITDLCQEGETFNCDNCPLKNICGGL